MSAPDNAVQAAREAPRPERDEVVEQTRRFADELFKFATPTQALWFAMPTALNATNRDRLFASGLQTLITRLALAERDRDAAINSASDGWRAAGEAQGKLEASETAGVVEGWRRRAEEAERLAEDRLEALKSVLFVPGGRPGGAVYVQWEEDADMRQCAPCAAKIMHAALTAAAEGTGSGGALVSVVRETKGDA